jgi:hypothetical protein
MSNTPYRARIIYPIEPGPDDEMVIPNVPFLKEQIESGYGRVEYKVLTDGRGQVGCYSISMDEMEAMGEAERIRLGFQKNYLFNLEKLKSLK